MAGVEMSQTKDSNDKAGYVVMNNRIKFYMLTRNKLFCNVISLLQIK